jgi:hypothetical protein
MIGHWIIIIFSIIVLFAVLFKPKSLLYFYAASLPLFGVIAEMGVQVTPVLLVSLGMILGMGIMGLHKIKIMTILLPYLIYTIILSIVMSFYLPDMVNHFPLFRGKLRWISQLVVFFLLFAPVIYIKFYKPSLEQLYKMIDVFLWAVVILCFSGILQLIVFKVAGKDIFPINLFSSISDKDVLRSGLSKIGTDQKILRMSALGGGEPKNFGYTCVIAFNLHLIRWLFKKPSGYFIVFTNLCMSALFLICILLSLSTQAYLLLAVNMVLLILFLLFLIGPRSKRLIIMFLLLCIGAFIVIKNDYASRLIEARIYERLAETGVVEDFNETIIDFLKDNPKFIIFGTGLGNIHFWAYEYIPHEFKYYMRNSVFVAKAGLLRLISEQGLVGLMLFISIVIHLIIKLHRRIKNGDRLMSSIALVFLVVVITDFFMSADASAYYVFSFVICFGVLNGSAISTMKIRYNDKNKSKLPVLMNGVIPD